MAQVTGRDGLIISEALAFAYAAMKLLPKMDQPRSNMADMRDLLFAKLGTQKAETALGQAMLLAWSLRDDVPRMSDREDMRRVREQVLQEPPGDPDVAVLVRHIDMLLAVRPTPPAPPP